MVKQPGLGQSNQKETQKGMDISKKNSHQERSSRRAAQQAELNA